MHLPPPRLLWDAAPGGELGLLPPGAIDLSQGREDDVLAVYVVGDSTMTCKVEFLPHHFAVRAMLTMGFMPALLAFTPTAAQMC
jgi:hypothetical protein